MIKSLFLTFLISLVSVPVWAGCDDVLETLQKEETPTTTFIAFLNFMIEQRHMSVDQYQIFINSLVSDRPQMPFTSHDLSSSAILYQFGEIFSKYLSYWVEHPEYLEKDTLIKIGKENLKKWKKEIIEKKETASRAGPILQMELADIPAGQLTITDQYRTRVIALSQPIKVQKFLVTQAMWAKLMGHNPSYFKDEKDFDKERINVDYQGTKIAVLPNHPIENINWYSVLLYANKLSENEGLEPVYDFSGVTEFTGEAKRGNYLPTKGIIRIKKTNGYRLPSIEEAEYIARGGTTTKYFFGDNEELLEEYAWFNENSNRSTHPVGEKKPNSFGLFDIHGNVGEWVGPSEEEEIIEIFGKASDLPHLFRSGGFDGYRSDQKIINFNHTGRFHGINGIRLIKNR